MKKNIKRILIHIVIYLILFYLIPFINVNYLPEGAENIISILFLVVINLIILMGVGTVDTYKNGLNFYMWLFVPVLFAPSVSMFYGSRWYVYILINTVSYLLGMLLGWSYKTYGHQLEPGYKKIFVEEKKKEDEEKSLKKIMKKENKKTKTKKKN